MYTIKKKFVVLNGFILHEEKRVKMSIQPYIVHIPVGM